MQREVEIVNRLGLHARAAAQLVTLAERFASDVRLRKGDREVSGKSIMGVMTLAAAQGARITLTVDGVDAQAAMEALCALIANRFGEDE